MAKTRFDEFYLLDYVYKPCSPFKPTDVLEDHVAFIFRVEE
jgi:hypothetical protein